MGRSEAMLNHFKCQDIKKNISGKHLVMNQSSVENDESLLGAIMHPRGTTLLPKITYRLIFF